MPTEEEAAEAEVEKEGVNLGLSGALAQVLNLLSLNVIS